MIWTLGRVVLIVLGLVCLVLIVATPVLIKPFPHTAPWYESAALFPRIALALAMAGAAVELFLRRKNLKLGESDELDTSSANLRTALIIAAVFVVYCLLVPVLGYLSSTFLFLLVAGRLAGLSLKAVGLLAIALSLAMWAVFKLGLKVAFGHGWLI
jgi:Tripartite tricarboxylate transporter TctB family